MTLKDAQKQKREQSQKVRTEQDCRPGDSQSKGQAGCDLLNSAEEPRPEGDKELAEWAAFDEVSKTIDDAHVENLHRTLFSHGRSQTKSGDPSFKDNGGDNDDDDDDDDSNFDMGDIAALMSRIQAMRSEISKIEDPQLARKRAAELAMALAKKT
ncbi:hypothetical protein LPJ75_002945 [Coemansia sp. RSA 2598]|nr:hypothetical protein LPJ75_002945 [Coemansia sp. RSA 2598]